MVWANAQHMILIYHQHAFRKEMVLLNLTGALTSGVMLIKTIAMEQNHLPIYPVDITVSNSVGTMTHFLWVSKIIVSLAHRYLRINSFPH
jgi:hypothetical protein